MWTYQDIFERGHKLKRIEFLRLLAKDPIEVLTSESTSTVRGEDVVIENSTGVEVESKRPLLKTSTFESVSFDGEFYLFQVIDEDAQITKVEYFLGNYNSPIESQNTSSNFSVILESQIGAKLRFKVYYKDGAVTEMEGVVSQWRLL